MVEHNFVNIIWTYIKSVFLTNSLACPISIDDDLQKKRAKEKKCTNWIRIFDVKSLKESTEWVNLPANFGSSTFAESVVQFSIEIVKSCKEVSYIPNGRKK